MKSARNIKIDQVFIFKDWLQLKSAFLSDHTQIEVL